MTPLTAIVILALAAGAPAAQQTPDNKQKPQTLTLSGCMSAAPASHGHFTFVDAATGSEYRLSGRGLAKFAGQKVEIVGGTGARRFVIRGGLLPSPNIAGQAGAIDPAQAAVASRPGGGVTGTEGRSLPEFRVTRVRALTGSCR